MEASTNQRLEKGQTIRVKIASLAPGGEGVSKDFGKPIFVNRVAPGDLADVRLFDVRKDFAKGELVNLVQPSAVRVEPPCKLFKVCGGCQWQHIQYAHQLEYKAEIVRQAIKHIAGMEANMVLPTLGAEQPLYYRNKVQFPVASVASTGRILAGYYAQNTHDLVNIKHCPVQPEPLDRALAAVKDELEHLKLTAYDEKTGLGLVRHIAERYSFDKNQVLLTLVVNAKQLDDRLRGKMHTLAETVMRAVPEVIGLCVNLNAQKGNRIIGDTTEVIAGQPFLIERLTSALPNAPELLKQGIQFRLSPTSFFQVNSMQAQVLLDQVLLAATNQQSVPRAQARFEQNVPLMIDAYAGVGTMALWLSTIGERIIAIEEVASSVTDGRQNVELNGLKNVEFIEAKVEVEAPKLARNGTKANVVVVDPPRKGLDPVGLEALVNIAPERIVYVSCNPATLARDLKLFAERGYVARQIQPIDLFPQTYHVESVTLLEKAGA